MEPAASSADPPAGGWRQAYKERAGAESGGQPAQGAWLGRATCHAWPPPTCVPPPRLQSFLCSALPVGPLTCPPFASHRLGPLLSILLPTDCIPPSRLREQRWRTTGGMGGAAGCTCGATATTSAVPSWGQTAPRWQPAAGRTCTGTAASGGAWYKAGGLAIPPCLNLRCCISTGRVQGCKASQHPAKPSSTVLCGTQPAGPVQAVGLKRCIATSPPASGMHFPPDRSALVPAGYGTWPAGGAWSTCGATRAPSGACSLTAPAWPAVTTRAWCGSGTWAPTGKAPQP